MENNKVLPDHEGWFWIKPEGYEDYFPCWFSGPKHPYFLPGGFGDSSRDGIYLDDIEDIGLEIEYKPK